MNKDRLGTVISLVSAVAMTAGGTASYLNAQGGSAGSTAPPQVTTAVTAETTAATTEQSASRFDTAEVFGCQVRGFDTVHKERFPTAEFIEAATGRPIGHLVLDCALCRSEQNGVSCDLILNKLWMTADSGNYLLFSALAMEPQSGDLKLVDYYPTNGGATSLTTLSFGVGVSEKEGPSISAGVEVSLDKQSMEVGSFSDVSGSASVPAHFGVSYSFNKPLFEDLSSTNRNMVRQCLNTTALSALSLESRSGSYDMKVSMLLIGQKDSLLNGVSDPECMLEYRMRVNADGSFSVSKITASQALSDMLEEAAEAILDTVGAEEVTCPAETDAAVTTELTTTTTTTAQTAEAVTSAAASIPTTACTQPTTTANTVSCVITQTTTTAKKAEPAASVIEDGGVYIFRTAFDPSLCIGTENNRTEHLSKVVLMNDSDASTRWQACYNSKKKMWVFRNAGDPSLVLNVYADKVVSNVRANLYHYIDGDPSQGWQLDYGGLPGTVRFKNAMNTGVSLECAGYACDCAKGTKVRVFYNQPTTELTQYFYFDRVG